MDIIFHGYKENNYNLLEINSRTKKRNENHSEYQASFLYSTYAIYPIINIRYKTFSIISIDTIYLL